MSNTNYQSLIEKLDGFIRKYYKNQLLRGFIYSIGLVLLFFYYTHDLPRPEKFTETPFIQSTKIYDRTGKVLEGGVCGADCGGEVTTRIGAHASESRATKGSQDHATVTLLSRYTS